MRIRIRKENDKFLCYFIDSRRIIGVDEIGARILDLLFNEEKKVEEITEILSQEYEIGKEKLTDDITNFLVEIRAEIDPDGFNIMDQEQLEVPLGVELEITASCNLHCIHCYQGEHPEIHMPTERAKEIISKLAKEGICEVSLIGGEPMRHPGLLEILQHCQKENLAINLITNATMIFDDWIENLSKIKRLVVIASLDGVGSIHDEIRGDGIFRKVDRVFKKMKATGIPLEVTCTLNALNISSYKKVIEYCADLDIPCNFNLFKPFSQEHEGLILDPEKYFETIIELFKLRNEEGYKIGLSNAAITAELMEIPARNECRATRSGVVIDVSGRMVVCPSLVSAGGFKQSDIPFFDDNFMDTWRNHGTFQKFRSNGLKECQARALIFSSDVQGFDPYGIEAFKQFLKSRSI